MLDKSSIEGHNGIIKYLKWIFNKPHQHLFLFADLQKSQVIVIHIQSIYIYIYICGYYVTVLLNYWNVSHVVWFQHHNEPYNALLIYV